jgi:hypothetical protein
VVALQILEAQKKDTIQHPTLGPDGCFCLEEFDLSTNKEFELVQGKEVNLAEYEAELEFRWKKRQTIPGVREGKTFQLPGLGKTYYIIKLEETQGGHFTQWAMMASPLPKPLKFNRDEDSLIFHPTTKINSPKLRPIC